MTWLYFALMTVVCWGLYGICLHSGVVGMKDQENGRWKAFLLVGAAYFLVAVLVPMIILFAKGASWGMPGKGLTWSLIAGLVGAAGAFFVLLALAREKPTAVMSIVFAGAPIVNAVVAMILHPPEGGFSSLRPPFLAGILLAALGGFLVSYYKPIPSKTPPKPAPAASVPDVRDAGR